MGLVSWCRCIPIFPVLDLFLLLYESAANTEEAYQAVCARVAVDAVSFSDPAAVETLQDPLNPERTQYTPATALEVKKQVSLGDFGV